MVVRDSIALWRTISERDYGIDGLIEFFPEGEASGRFMLVQVKGTEEPLRQLSNKPLVSTEVNLTTLTYAHQMNTPVLMAKVGLGNSSICYGILQELAEQQSDLEERARANSTKKTTCHLDASLIVDETVVDLGTRLWSLYQNALDGRFL